MECREVKFTGHALRRLFERGIGVDAVEFRLQDKEIAMKCALCKQGETRPGQVTVTLQRGETTIIFKGVPADACNNCGEYYLSEKIAREVMQRAEESVKSGAEVEILRFAA